MKVKNTLILSVLLVFLLIGAASAADDADILQDTTDGAVDVASDGDDAVLENTVPDEDKYDPSTRFCIPFEDGDVYMDGNHYKFGVNVHESDATGRVVMYIDENEVYNEEVVPYYEDDYDDDYGYRQYGGNTIYLEDLNLEFKSHTYEIKYLGDDHYRSISAEGTFIFDFMEVDVPETFMVGHDTIEVRFPSDAGQGDIVLYINGKEYSRQSMISTDYAYFELDELDYGTYDYRVTYTGDDRYPEKSVSGKLHATYYFNAYREDDYDEGLTVGSSVMYYVYLPSDATGPITVNFNGNTRKVTPDEDETAVIFDNLKLGENIIKFTYSDKKYPERTLEYRLFAHPILEFESEIEFSSGKGVTLVLDSNSKGNLVISSRDDWDNLTTIAKVPLSNGKASVDLSDLPIGYHSLVIDYDGDDFDFESRDAYVHVTVIDDVPYYMWNGQDNVVNVITPDEEKSLRIVLHSAEGDYDDDDDFVYYYQKVLFDKTTSGKVTVSIPKLEAGEYAVSIYYGEDYKTRSFHVRDHSPEFDLNVIVPSEIPKKYVSFDITDLPYGIEGRVELYVDGVLVETDDIYDFTESIGFDAYDLSIGKHTYRIVFSEDPYYKSSEKTGSFVVSWIDMPESINLGDAVRIYMGDEYDGFISLVVDGKDYKMEFLIEGTADITIDNLSVDKHSYKVSYINKQGKTVFTKSGEFTVEYYIGANIDSGESYRLTDSFEFFVDVPQDATADVVVTYNGKDYTATPVNGTARIVLTNLVEGSETVRVTYSGDSKYPSQSINVTLDVSGVGVTAKSDPDTYVIKSLSIYAPGEEGTFTVLLNDDEYQKIDLVNGKAEVTLDDLPVGRYYVRAYLNDEEYLYDDYFTVEPEVTGEFETNDGKTTITVKLPSNLEGHLIAYLDDEQIADIEVPANGEVSVPLSGLTFGEHILTFSYTGDDMENIFYNGEDYREYYIYVEPEKITIPSDVASDGKTSIDMKLFDGAKGTATVSIDNDEYKTVKVSGKSVSIPISGLEAGEHYIHLKYVDDNLGEYYAFEYAVVALPTPKTSIDIPTKATEKPGFSVVLPKDATGSLIVSVNGKNYAATLVNGQANIEISEAEGNYEATITYSGDGRYEGFTTTKNIATIVAVDPKITARDMSMQYSDGSKYSVTVYGTDGKLAVGKTVTFKLNGKKIGTAKTNAKGVATIKITQIPKSYKITAEALGKSVTKKLTVKQILSVKKVTPKKSAKKLVLTATLKKVKGKYIKGKTITFKFNGKKLTAKTNKKGVAKVTVKKAVLKKLKAGKKITYSATYLKDTVKVTVKVKK